MLLLMVRKSGSTTCYVRNPMKHGIFSRVSSIINSPSPQPLVFESSSNAGDFFGGGWHYRGVCSHSLKKDTAGVRWKVFVVRNSYPSIFQPSIFEGLNALPESNSLAFTCFYNKASPPKNHLPTIDLQGLKPRLVSRVKIESQYKDLY